MKKKLVLAALCVLAIVAVIALTRLMMHAPGITVALQAGPAQPRVGAAEGGIDSAAIHAAVAYAGARNTHALVIARGGHIVFEKYWDGFSADSAVRFDELSAVIAGVLLGTALNDRLILDIDMPLSRYLGDAVADAQTRTLRTLLTEWDAETLAEVLERVGGQPYQVLVAERLWKPLGNGDIAFAERKKEPRKGRADATCCIRARIGDWMRFGQLLARDGVFEANQYTPPGFVHAMLRSTRKDVPRGYFTRLDGAFATRDVAWVGGEDHQRMWLVPSLDLVILRVGGAAGSAGWDETLIPNSIIRGTSGWQPASSGEGADPKRFAPH